MGPPWTRLSAGGISFALQAGDQIHDKGDVGVFDPKWKFKRLDIYERKEAGNEQKI